MLIAITLVYKYIKQTIPLAYPHLGFIYSKNALCELMITTAETHSTQETEHITNIKNSCTTTKK